MARGPRASSGTYVLVHGGLVLLEQLVRVLAEGAPLGLQLLVQSAALVLQLRPQLVFQHQQLLLVLPPHALVPRHLLSQLRILLMLLDRRDDLDTHTQ